MAKEYPLEINRVFEYEGGYTPTYYSKGHHDPATFAAELRRGWDVDAPLNLIEQHYYRNVPTGNGSGQYMQTVYRPGQGAYPVTVFDSWENS